MDKTELSEAEELLIEILFWHDQEAKESRPALPDHLLQKLCKMVHE